MYPKSLALAILAFIIEQATAINCKGCTPLDSLTFDKVIGAFRVSVVKFDTAYPYGDKHEEFAKVAVDAAEKSDVFVGEVGIKDYGEKDNEELGTRFKVVKEDYPVVYVFVKKAGKLSEHRFAEEFTAENLKNFIRQKTGVYLPMPGCIEVMDEAVDTFLKSDDLKSALGEAKKFAESKNFSGKNEKRAAVYVKFMEKVAEKGRDFVDIEMKRMNKLLDSDAKMAPAKKAEVEEKLNILKSFASALAEESAKVKQEL